MTEDEKFSVLGTPRDMEPGDVDEVVRLWTAGGKGLYDLSREDVIKWFYDPTTVLRVIEQTDPPDKLAGAGVGLLKDEKLHQGVISTIIRDPDPMYKDIVLYTLLSDITTELFRQEEIDSIVAFVRKDEPGARTIFLNQGYLPTGFTTIENVGHVIFTRVE